MKSIPLLGGLLLSSHQVLAQSDPRVASLDGFTEVPDPYYGQSPPVYPTRKNTRALCIESHSDLHLAEGDGGVDKSWQNAYARARELVSQMTLDEKVNMTHGHEGDCVGNTPSIERLGIPKLW